MVLYLLETNVRHSSILGYVGAGGIGLLLNEKISWLEYGKVGMILFFLFLTVCVIEGISGLLSQIIREERSLSPLGKRLLTGAAVLLALVCTLSLQPPDFSHISPRAVQAMISGLFHPDWAFFFETDTSGLGYLLLETVCIALVGTCAGTVIAVPLSFLSTPCLMPKLPALLFRVVIMAIRSVPFLIYGLIFIRVAGPGPFTGVLTLGVCSVGLLSKRFTEAIESLDFRAYHALESMGRPSPAPHPVRRAPPAAPGVGLGGAVPLRREHPGSVGSGTGGRGRHRRAFDLRHEPLQMERGRGHRPWTDFAGLVH